MSVVIGLDPSLSGFGIALWPSFTTWRLAAGPPAPNVAERIARYQAFITGIMGRLPPSSDVAGVYLEGYSYNSRGSVVQLGEFGGLLRDALLDVFGGKLVEVPPAVVKRFAAGKGNALPLAVCTATMRRYGLSDSLSEDEYTACAIAALGACCLGMKAAETEQQREAVEMVLHPTQKVRRKKK